MQKKRWSTIYVNNRLEGNAPLTIAAFLAGILQYLPCEQRELTEMNAWAVIVTPGKRFSPHSHLLFLRE